MTFLPACLPYPLGHPYPPSHPTEANAPGIKHSRTTVDKNRKRDREATQDVVDDEEPEELDPLDAMAVGGGSVRVGLSDGVVSSLLAGCELSWCFAIV